MHVTIRPELPGDFDEIHAVVAEAFDSNEHAELVSDIRSSGRYWADAALVATAADTVVGHVMISSAELRGPDSSVDIAMLSPLAVTSEHRRRGIGDALVRAVCAVAGDRGEPMVLLQGNPAYYSRFGFVPSNQHGITMDLPEWAPIEAAQVLCLAAWTGQLRGHLVEPPAFAHLD